MNVREAWNLIYGKIDFNVVPVDRQRIKEAEDVIHRFGIYGDTLKEMENGERYEAEFGAMTPEERETAFGIDALTSLPDPDQYDMSAPGPERNAFVPRTAEEIDASIDGRGPDPEDFEEPEIFPGSRFVVPPSKGRKI